MKREEAQTIARWLNTTLLPMVNEIYEFARVGDEGWLDSMRGYIDDINLQTKIFIQDHLIPPDPVSSTEKDYQAMLQRLSGKQEAFFESTGDDLSAGEYVQLYKARLFHHMMLQVRKDPEPLENLKTFAEIFTYLEGELLGRSEFVHKFYTDRYMNSGEKALSDVATYILEQRAKAPQTRLFS